MFHGRLQAMGFLVVDRRTCYHGESLLGQDLRLRSPSGLRIRRDGAQMAERMVVGAASLQQIAAVRCRRSCGRFEHIGRAQSERTEGLVRFGSPAELQHTYDN